MCSVAHPDTPPWSVVNCVVVIVRVRRPNGHDADDGLCGSDCADARVVRRGGGGEQGRRAELKRSICRGRVLAIGAVWKVSKNKTRTSRQTLYLREICPFHKANTFTRDASDSSKCRADSLLRVKYMHMCMHMFV